LIDKTTVVVANLEPRVMMGIQSQAMLVAVKDEENLSVIIPEKVMSMGLKLS
jgi:methionyl-tRNA synthetase